MKKKFLIAFLAITAALCCAVGFTACDDGSGNGGGGHTHDYAESVVEATCTEKGYKLFTCSCGDSYKEEIAAKGHTYETKSVTVEASCTNEGLVRKKCKTCGDEKDEVTAVLPHKSVNYPEQAATCVQAGYSGGKYCEVCKNVLEEREEIPATGIHTPVDYEDKKETCGEAGYRGGQYCEICEAVLTERTEIPATGKHTEVKDAAVNATCSSVGYTEGSHCSVCKAVLIQPTEIPKTSHSYTSSVITPPAYQIDGNIKHTCKVCNYSYEEAIPALTYQPSDIWKGDVAEGFEEGDGTQQSPYIIKTAAQLKYFADSVNARNRYQGKYIKLANDIILNDTANRYNWTTSAPQNEWTPIGVNANIAFCGNFDGNNYAVKGMYVKNQGDYGGLFGYVTDARISNLTVSESYVLRDGGGIVGYCDEYDGQSIITNCRFDGAVEGKYIAGGIIGYARMGALQGINTIHTGFISLKNCSNSGTIKTSRQLDKTDKMFGAGGLIGYANVYAGQLDVSGSFNKGKINAVSGAGGLVGRLAYSSATYQFNTEIKNCYNAGEVAADELCAGGLAGYLWLSNNACELKISNCYNTANVKAKHTAGGLIATVSVGSDSKANVEKCYNTGSVSSGTTDGNSAAGGLFGEFSCSYSKNNYNSVISGCFNSGVIEGANKAGGIIGGLSGAPTVDSCYNSGNITGGQSVGGIAGNVFGGSSFIAEINNSYNTGKISGKNSVGGIAGYASNTVALKYCYNVGEVTGSEYFIGAVVGNSELRDNAENCYYLNNCAKDGSGKIQAGYGAASDGEQVDYYYSTCKGYDENLLTQQTTYKNFSFTKVWKMPDEAGYPVLRNVAVIVTEEI